MRKLLSAIIASSLIAGLASAQSIKQQNSSFEDFLPLFEMDGLQMYSFDISQLSDSKRIFEFVIHEYAGDSLINDNYFTFPMRRATPNIRFTKEFGEQASEIKPEEMADPQRGIYSMSEKFNIGLKNYNDSTKSLLIDMVGMRQMNERLPLKSITFSDDSTPKYVYQTRPFKLGSIKEDEFIPLILIGSAWLDKRFNIIRFCGEKILDPELDNNMIIKDIPHYYIVGVKISHDKSDK